MSFLRYCALGWLVEVIFTGLCSALRRDRNLKAETSLWSGPAFGLGAVLIEALAFDAAAQGLPLVLRLPVYLFVVYGVEYGYGALLRALGIRAWEYTSGWHFDGLINLSYLPLWGLLVLAFEKYVLHWQ